MQHKVIRYIVNICQDGAEHNRLSEARLREHVQQITVPLGCTRCSRRLHAARAGSILPDPAWPVELIVPEGPERVTPHQETGSLVAWLHAIHWHSGAALLDIVFDVPQALLGREDPEMITQISKIHREKLFSCVLMCWYIIYSLALRRRLTKTLLCPGELGENPKHPLKSAFATKDCHVRDSPAQNLS